MYTFLIVYITVKILLFYKQMCVIAHTKTMTIVNFLEFLTLYLLFSLTYIINALLQPHIRDLVVLLKNVGVLDGLFFLTQL